MKTPNLLSFATVVFTVTLISICPSYAAEKPNVVLMVMDNLGWGEVGAYGGGILRGAETPRIDSLADEGMKLLNFNVEPQCTPSRSALMSVKKGAGHGFTVLLATCPF